MFSGVYTSSALKVEKKIMRQQEQQHFLRLFSKLSLILSADLKRQNQRNKKI
jgi:hypothetical protein